MKMKMPLLIESIDESGTHWGVSLNSSNPTEEDYIGCETKEQALKLIKAIEIKSEHSWIYGYVCMDCGRWIFQLNEMHKDCRHSRIKLPEHMSAEEVLAAMTKTYGEKDDQ